MPAPKGNDFAKGNKGGGRKTSFKPEYVVLAEKLSKLGLTDRQMADVFEVSEVTINNWKIKHEDFCLALKNGKLIADAEVSEKLFNRATGYQYTETKKEFEDILSKKPTKIVETTKTVVPDTTAAIFWLKNRQPEYWRDTKHIDHTNNGKSFDMTPEERAKRIQTLKDKLKQSTEDDQD